AARALDLAADRSQDAVLGRVMPACPHAAVPGHGARTGAGAGDVGANLRHRALGRLQQLAVAPGHRNSGEVHLRVGVGEPLAGVVPVMRALVAGVELALARPLADVLIGGPALGAGVDCGPGRVVAVVGDVVTVLVGDRVIVRHPVGGAADA